MGIRSGTSIRRLLVHCVQIELEFGDVGFWGEGKTGVLGRKTFQSKDEDHQQTQHQVRESYPGHLSVRRVLSPLRHPCSPKHPRASTLNALAFTWSASQLPSISVSPGHSRLYGQSLLLVRGSQTRRTCDSRRNRNARFKAIAYVRLRSHVRHFPWREGGIAWGRGIHLH